VAIAGEAADIAGLDRVSHDVVTPAVDLTPLKLFQFEPSGIAADEDGVGALWLLPGRLTFGSLTGCHLPSVKANK